MAARFVELRSARRDDRRRMARDNEGAAGVAGPDAVGGPAVEANVLAQSVGLAQDLARVLFRGCVVDDQVDALVPARWRMISA